MDVMPDPSKLAPDRAVAQAARASTVHGWTGTYTTGLKSPEEDHKLLQYLWRNGHHSPWEMVELKFHVKAPLMVIRQWQRHRTWNFNEMSGRYQEYQEEFYVPEPEQWRRQDPKNKQSSSTEHLKGFYTDALLDNLQAAMEYYHWALEDGVAREQARLFLPAFALYSEMYAKVDLRNLLHFLKERSHPDAQWEMQEYANAIKSILKEVVPWTYELAFGKN